MMVPCTVVSILPYALLEEKPVNPGTIFIPPVEKGDVGIFVISKVTRDFYVDYDRGVIQIPEDPETVCRSVVEDHIKATIYADTVAHPGLFYLSGAKTKDQVKASHQPELEQATKCQDTWFEKLIRVADDNWQKFRKHSVISDQYRLAARRLGLKREWADIVNTVESVPCEYCTTLISNKAVICPQCRMMQTRLATQLSPTVRETIEKALARA